MKTCTDCKKRSTCKRLCDAAEKYVNQDYSHGNSEIVCSQLPQVYNEDGELINLVESIVSNDTCWSNSTTVDLDREIFRLYYIKHLTLTGVAEELYCTRDYVYRVVSILNPYVVRYRKENGLSKIKQTKTAKKTGRIK